MSAVAKTAVVGKDFNAVERALRHAPQCSHLVAPCDCGCDEAVKALSRIRAALRTWSAK